MGPAEKHRVTSAEYLAFERASESKHELVDGEVFAMAGAKRRHNQIVINIGAEARGALRQKRCEIYASDMRVRIPATDRYVYPDLSIACGTPRFEDEAEDTLLDPLVVFEVLSASTEAYDRGEKFEAYQSVPSLADYVLVATSHARVDHFRRQDDGSWVLRSYGPGERIHLASCGCEIAIDEVYLKAFGEPAAAG